MGQLAQVLVGGRDDPDVGRQGIFGSQWLESSLFDQSHELGLSLEAHLSDVVHEESAPVRQQHYPFLVTFRIRKRVPDMSEELVFDQLVRDGCGTDLDEAFVSPLAALVEHPGHQLLAGTAFAEEQDPSTRGSRGRDLFPQPLHSAGFPDQMQSGPESFLELDVLLFQPFLPQGILGRQHHHLQGKGFFQEVEGTQFGGFNGGFNRPVSCDHDHLDVLFFVFDLFQDLYPVHLRKPDVQEHQVILILRQELEALFPGGRGPYRIPLVLQDTLQG